jgi:hypothetical protein
VFAPVFLFIPVQNLPVQASCFTIYPHYLVDKPVARRDAKQPHNRHSFPFDKSQGKLAIRSIMSPPETTSLFADSRK